MILFTSLRRSHVPEILTLALMGINSIYNNTLRIHEPNDLILKLKQPLNSGLWNPRTSFWGTLHVEGEGLMHGSHVQELKVERDSSPARGKLRQGGAINLQ